MKGRLYPILVILAFLLPNIYFILIGRESFPFTQAPMFAHYIGDSTKFYEFNFVLKNDSGSAKKISPDYLKNVPVYEISLNRFFFGNIYGSIEEKSPFGYFENDSVEAFEQRMTSFFFAYFKSLDQASGKIWLEVLMYNRNYNLIEKHAIGYYDIKVKQFTHTWKEN